ncbi:MAG: LysR family transcriptional regulator [Allorhizobium sp.]
MTEPLSSRLQTKHFALIKAVSDLGQLSLAASALGITQPAASRMLGEIERLTATPIFIRTPKGMEPTPVGGALARRAQNLLEEFREAAREVDAIKRGLSGTVRVGAVTGGAVGFLVPAIHALKAEAATADVHVDVAASGALLNDLVNGQVDFILGRIPSGTDARQFDILNARIEEVDLLVHQSHPLAAAVNLAFADLVHFSWVMQAPGAPVREAVESVFIEAGAPIPSNIVNTTSLLVMIAMMASSNAIAAMSSEVSDLLCRQGTGPGLKRLDINRPIIVAPYHLITIKGKRLTPVASRLRDLLRAQLEARAAAG